MKNLFLTILFLSCGFTAFTQKAYKIGDVAMDFSLKNTNGKMVSMSDYKDAKGYVLIFTCNHCPYAKMYEKELSNSVQNIRIPAIR